MVHSSYFWYATSFPFSFSFTFSRSLFLFLSKIQIKRLMCAYFSLRILLNPDVFRLCISIWISVFIFYFILFMIYTHTHTYYVWNGTYNFIVFIFFREILFLFVSPLLFGSICYVRLDIIICSSVFRRLLTCFSSTLCFFSLFIFLFFFFFFWYTWAL